jgi:hypothetical protein
MKILKVLSQLNISLVVANLIYCLEEDVIVALRGEMERLIYEISFVEC